MGVSVTLSPSELEVTPGQEGTVEVTVRNTGPVVDQFALNLVGDVDGWVSVEPRMVNLFPEGEARARLVFRPPKTADVLAGEYPFGLRVLSREDPEGSTVEEGSATVTPFTQIGTEFVPHGSHGSLRGRHRLAVDNHGNTPTPVQIGLIDQNNRLRFKIRKQALTVPAGITVLIVMRAIPRKWFLKGQKKTHTFQATVVGDTFEPVTADAAMVQEQVLPTWLPGLLAAVAALAVVGTVLWYTVLKPTIRSEATLAAQTVVNQLSAGMRSAEAQASGASKQAQADRQALVQHGILPSPGATPTVPVASAQHTPAPKTSANSGSANSGSGKPGSGKPGSPKPRTTSSPTAGSGSQSASAADFSVVTSTAPGRTASFTSSLTTPKGHNFLISDYIISNPNGDTGTVTIKTKTSGVTLIVLNLSDFRNTDEHFVDPIPLVSGNQIVMTVTCANTASQGHCSPQAFFNGQVK
jgi:hypothetical protein